MTNYGAISRPAATIAHSYTLGTISESDESQSTTAVDDVGLDAACTVELQPKNNSILNFDIDNLLSLSSNGLLEAMSESDESQSTTAVDDVELDAACNVELQPENNSILNFDIDSLSSLSSNGLRIAGNAESYVNEGCAAWIFGCLVVGTLWAIKQQVNMPNSSALMYLSAAALITFLVYICRALDGQASDTDSISDIDSTRSIGSIA